jgi:hypothetical protein
LLLRGDCLEQLKTLEENSIDSLVTDPPAGISFMGKDWDDGENFIPSMTAAFTECLRVLKPGAHGLVWALPRTSHWTATALEYAGFEIRDVVTHLFGSGFPKSLDISKAIDKAAGVERKVIGKYQSPEGTSGESKGALFNGGGLVDITSPATDEAKQWQGWGTALKPASEHWILVRKPLSEKTVAKNVLKHGTGGINIDASRISVAKDDPNHRVPSQGNAGANSIFGVGGHDGNLKPQGRFPANLVLDEVAAEMLDEQSGKCSGSRPHVYKNSQPREGRLIFGGYADSGGASRFFYVAKASKKDRGEDNKHPTVKSTKLMEYLIKLVTPPNGVVLDPFMGSGSTGKAAVGLGFKFIGIEKNEEYFEIAKRRIDGNI